MAATAGPRKTISIYDYPEHLNPFREDDNHKFRFWTMGRKLNRSNSINFSGIKDLKNSWALRSFMKKGKKKESTSAPATQEYTKPSQTNGHSSSPIVFRRAMQYSSMRGHTSPPDRFVYGGSVTPLPRSRFQERLRSSSQYDLETSSLTPRMARSEVSGSRLSVESTNPFEEAPVAPVRMPRRKKKKAPPPPPQRNMDITVTSITSDTINENSSNSTQTTINESTDDIDVEMAKLNIELKIIEDEDLNSKVETNNNNESPKIVKSPDKTPPNTPQNETMEIDIVKSTKEKQSLDIANGNSDEDLLEDASFPKVNIVRYRRNSSVNEDEIRLRRGNLEDFQASTFKRSKSLTNTSDSHHVIYDIDLNENVTHNTTVINEPQKVICKVYDNNGRKQSIDNSISSTDRELDEIDEATRQLQKEINKLNSALKDDEIDICNGNQKENDTDAPNPIPKPRRSNYADKESFLRH